MQNLKHLGLYANREMVSLWLQLGYMGNSMSEEDIEWAKRRVEQQEEKPLPVAVYMGVYGGKHIVGFTESKIYPVGTALYLHPPKPKTTVYLTRDEIVELLDKFSIDSQVVHFARAIEQEVLRRNK